MSDFLSFSICAPLASWGEIAVGEVRDSLDRPTRSAVLGLLAGALGVDRADDAAQVALERGYGVAVRALETGAPMRDYHTTQTAPAAAVKRHRPATRRELLSCVAPETPETIVSTRTYRQGSLSVIVLWARPGDAARWSLAELATALRAPHFVPYAGRKANALGLPTGAEVIAAESLAAAMQASEGRLVERLQMLADMGAGWLRRRAAWSLEVHHDHLEADGIAAGALDNRVSMTRRDGVADRGRWQFSERRVHVSQLRTEGK